MRGAGARRPGQPADARLRDAVHEAEMLAAAVLARPYGADFRIDDLDRSTELRAHCIAEKGHGKLISPSNQEHAIDAIGAKFRNPGRGVGIMECRYRLRGIGAALERGFHSRPVLSQQQRQTRPS